MNVDLKLVIWDLDNTLWRGTLAEGDTPILIPQRAEIIKKLTDIGVVNSICSKNDYEKARKLLTEMGLWEYFVFPKIDFAPKGLSVKVTLNEMHLRAENTLFIDDDVSNLNEVSYYNPGIMTLLESSCEKIFSQVLTIPVKNSSRLDKYKQLEQKNFTKSTFSSNEAFLRSSNIRIEFLNITNQSLFNRLCELSERTNQLNFTKNRMNPQELFALLNNPNVETKMIHAIDNFGDYGIIGFYSVYQRNLIHFVFSCRIMNMGIEQFVWQYLGRPNLKIVGDTASNPMTKEKIDYIKIINGTVREYDAESIENILKPESQINIFALGACDLFHPIAYFSMPNNYFFYECNVFLGNERGVNVGTEYIRSQTDMTDDEKDFCRRHFNNYRRHNVFKSKIFDEIWDYVIISFHDDMIYKIYEHKKDPNLRIVFSPEKKFGDTSVRNILGQESVSYEEQRAWLAENFKEGHYITAQRFEENLLWIANKLPEKTKIILINGPTFDFFREKFQHCPEARTQIFTINEVIQRVCNKYKNKFSLVDINKVIHSKMDVTDYIFHLKAQTAFNLFVEITNAMLRFSTPPPCQAANAE